MTVPFPHFGTKLATALTGALFSSWLALQPIQAAEQLTLHIGAAERSLDVDDLTTFVTTTEVPASLNWYADQFSAEELEELRTLLTTPFDVEPVQVSRFLNTPLGEALLSRLLILFNLPDPDHAVLALRASMVNAAFADGGMTILNMIQEWPLREVPIDFDVALQSMDEAKSPVCRSRGDRTRFTTDGTDRN